MSNPQFYDLASHQRINDLQAQVGGLRNMVEQGGSGSGGKEMSSHSDELTDLKIAVAEARSDTKNARLEGKIDLLATSIATLGAKIDGQRSEASSNRNVIITAVIGSALAIIALVYTILSYGASTFYNGTVVRDLVHNEISAVAQKTDTGGSAQQH